MSALSVQAEWVLPWLVHPELGELAQRIIEDQSAEMEQMGQLILEPEAA